jgi:DNA-binding transcriptional regulator YiaG
MTTIKDARKKAGLTQQAMSDIMDIPIRTIKDWDRGAHAPAPWVEKLVIEKLEGIGKNK